MQVVFAAPNGIDATPVRTPIAEVVENVRTNVPGAEVTSPLEDAGQRQVSADGTIAYAEVNLADRELEEFAEAADTLERLPGEHATDAVRIELGGTIITPETDGGVPTELIGLLAAVVILLVAFGSLIAIGAGIDDALLVVTRYREGCARAWMCRRPSCAR